MDLKEEVYTLKNMLERELSEIRKLLIPISLYCIKKIEEDKK